MTDLQARRAAATARGQQVRAAADRPSQRRCSEDPTSRPAAAFRAQLALRTGATEKTVGFHGLASATDAPYEMWDMFGEYTELVTPGAFAKTLAQVDLDVPLVLQHQSLTIMADTVTGTLALSETSEGLEVDAPALSLEDVDVAYIVPKIRAGLIREMSFKFIITRGSWSPDWMEYHIEEVDLDRGDVAIVGKGANPSTNVGLRAVDEPPVELARRSDDYVLEQFRGLRNELRSRGLKPPMSLEDLRTTV